MRDLEPYNPTERQYRNLLKFVLQHGEWSQDRTGTGTFRVFAPAPIHIHDSGVLTCKRIHYKSVVGELLWFLRGDTNIRWLNENGIRIWDEWADENGDLGPVYGAQWAKQLPGVIEEIRTNPNSRRLIVNSWQLVDLPKMALPPCHTMFQFAVLDGWLQCQVYQRSGDLFLGVPFNMASYRLLTHIVAQECGLRVGATTLVLGDAHVYANHVAQANEYLSRSVRTSPHIRLTSGVGWDKHTFNTIELCDYDPHPTIKAKVAV